MRIWILSAILLGLSISAAVAAQYDIKQMTPAVQSALESRKSRFSELKALKAKGVVGENNQGYVELLGNDPSAEGTVAAENKDRRFIYETIVTQNGLSESALSTVESVFAGVQREKASSGEKVQDPSGEWISKP